MANCNSTDLSAIERLAYHRKKKRPRNAYYLVSMGEYESLNEASERDPFKENAATPAATPAATSPTQNRISMYRLLWTSPVQTKFSFLIATVGTCTFAICMALVFYVVGQLVDELTEEEEDDYDYYHETVKIVASIYIMAALVLVGAYLGVIFFVRVGQDIAGEVRHRYFQAMIAKDIEFYDTHSKSSLEVPQHMNRCCEILEQGAGEKLFGFIEAICYVTFAFGISIEKSPQLFLVALSILPVAVVATALIGFSIVQGAVMRQDAYRSAGGISEEALLEIKTVHAHNAQADMSKRYDNELSASVSAVSKSGLIQSIGWGVLWGSWCLMGVVVFWTAAKWVSDERHNWIWGDDIEGTDVFVIFWEMAYTCNLLGNIIGGLVAVIEAEVAAYSAQEFIDIQSKFVDGETVTEIVGTIEFKDVKFAYPKAPMVDVLKGVSFVMEANRSYAIVGESGAGKSTIIQLIERFYEPTGGLLLIDNQPVSSYDIKDLRRQIGYVSQEPILFNLTIRESILMSKKDASDAEIEEALKHANAYDFINNLEKKLDQNVGMKGSQLSGGQKQRVAIARAIIKKPKILLLDEATSALDNLSEALVLQALKEIIRNFQMTTVSVAQKLSTIRHVDKIIVLEDGFVSQEGSHSELMSKEGKYQTMCRTQGIDFEKVIQTTNVGTAATIEILNTVALPREETHAESATPFNSLLLRILKISSPYWPLLIIGLAAACGAGLSFPIFGAFIGKETYYILGRSGDEMEDNIRKFAFFTLILAVFVVIFFLFMFWCFAVLTAYISRDLRSKAFYQMLHYDAEFFDKAENNSSILAQNLTTDTEQVNSAGGPLIGMFLVIIVGLGGSVGIAFMWNYKLALLITASVPVQLFALFRGYSSLFTGLAHPELQQAKQMGLDVMINLKMVKAYGVEQELVTKNQSLYQTAYASTAPEAHANGLYLGFGVGLVFASYATIYWYAGYLQKKDDIGFEDLLISIMANLMASYGIFTAAVYIPAVGQGIHAARRIFGIIDYVPKINAQAIGRKDAVEGPIEFKDVCFSYAGRDSVVLDHVNFKVLKNQKIGVTGPSGSGKTTIVQLILRFYDPTSGQIHINGIDITTFDLKHLRTYISTVGQEPVLFRGSLRHNIGFGYKDEEGHEASDAAILSAMEQAKVNFTGDLDYEIGARGQTISGGQKQRVSIARAIVRNPKILLFDEATSALDSQTERDIMATLEEVGKERTVILIAHRLSTIRQCDNILVMEGGRITEQGTHEELLGQDGQYAGLWNSVNKQA